METGQSRAFGCAIHLDRRPAPEADRRLRRTKRRLGQSVAALAVLFVSTARAEDPDVRSAPGIDWENLMVRATGAGPPDVNALGREQARAGAEKAAKSDAFRNLLEQVKGVPVNAATTVGQAMAAEEIRGKVEEVVRNYKVTSKRYYS